MTGTIASNDKKNWEMILNLSENMLESAEKRDWESLTLYMNAREKVMNAYFSIPLMEAEEIARQAEEDLSTQENKGAAMSHKTGMSKRIEILKHQIEHIKKNDRLIISITAQNKDLLARELLKLQKARKMVVGYAQNSNAQH